MNRSINLILLLSLFMMQDNAISKSPEPTYTIDQRAGAKEFKIYDGTLYQNKPDMREYGIVEIPMVYVSKIWKGWKDMNSKQRSALPQRAVVREIAKSVNPSDGSVIVNVEHWNIRAKGSELQENVTKYVQLLEWFKQDNPKVKWGYFARPPVRDYNRSILGPEHYKYRRWQRMNDGLKPLAEVVDIIYPSLYTRYNDPASWREYAKQNIAESRRLADGKPVIAFLWPQFKKSDQNYSQEYIPAGFWREQLETVYEYADGVVIWGGWDVKRRGKADWSEDLAWWQVLKRFIRDKGIQPVEH